MIIELLTKNENEITHVIRIVCMYVGFLSNNNLKANEIH